jgi:hypothetical protein
MDVPLKQWQALAVDVNGKQVTVSHNGKPLPALTRRLPAYTGGRVGIHTQGDTVALFDGWTVTAR